MPQRWHVKTNKLYQFDIDTDPQGHIHVTKWKALPKNQDKLDRLKTFLKTEIRRLRRLKNIVWNIDGTVNTVTADRRRDIPLAEYTAIMDFTNANIVAFTVGLQHLESLNLFGHNASQAVPTTAVLSPITATTYAIQTDGGHYDPLIFEPDNQPYELYTCDTDDAFNMVGFEELEKLQTSYQSLVFNVRNETDDLCLSLDNIIQICANYRPHYHEYITHGGGRFVKDVKRIMFIGGGDSMLLHEALKYPNLEKVVGLELDQTVTRKCFKHFHTSPHFDNDKVEWWFGDATKSLLLLPEDYWGSFDLVLVDLSETAMSLSVTDDLDVFDALALLLSPEGVMVKNELYLEKFSKVFDYTMEMYYESPVICSQGENERKRKPKKGEPTQSNVRVAIGIVVSHNLIVLPATFLELPQQLPSWAAITLTFSAVRPTIMAYWGICCTKTCTKVTLATNFFMIIERTLLRNSRATYCWQRRNPPNRNV
jgi:spermidine synthase